LGLGTTVQVEPPVQCSMMVWRSPVAPATQTLHAERWSTPLRLSPLPVSPGLAGCPPVQAWQVTALAAVDPSPVSTPPSSSGTATIPSSRPVFPCAPISGAPFYQAKPTADYDSQPWNGAETRRLQPLKRPPSSRSPVHPAAPSIPRPRP